MRNLWAIVLMVCTMTGSLFSTTHTIVNDGFAFSPDALTITLGDTVVFNLASIHTAREVSKATWDANGTTSDGGFDLPFGGGTVVLTTVGDHYYVCVPHASLGMKGVITVLAATGVNTVNAPIPDKFALRQNYPNPFNPTTVISFDVPTHAFVSLKIFNILGKEVSNLVSEDLTAGTYKRTWNASALPGGVYFYRLQAGTYSETRKLVFMK